MLMDMLCNLLDPMSHFKLTVHVEGGVLMRSIYTSSSSLSVREVKAGTQTGQEPRADAKAEEGC